MKKISKVLLVVLSWILRLLIIPDLIIAFVIPVLFESTVFWQNNILLSLALLIFSYPFLTTWALTNAKILQKQDFCKKAWFFTFLPLFSLGAVVVLYTVYNVPEMDKILVLILSWM